MFERRDTSKMSLEEKIQILMDERDIRDVIYRDNRGRSRSDVALLKSCFWEDAVDHHQPWFNLPVGVLYGQADQVPADAEDAPPPDRFETCQYVTHQILIDIDGDTARAESYATSYKVFHERSADGHKQFRASGIRNLDRFERRNGEWRIAERQFLGEWGFFQEVPPLEEAISIYGPGTDANHVVTTASLSEQSYITSADGADGAPQDNSLAALKTSMNRSDPSYSPTYHF